MRAFINRDVFVFALLLVFVIVSSQRPMFRLDYQYERAFNSFYKLHRAAGAWREARLRCQAEGAELLVPEDLDEADAIPMIIASILVKFPGVFVGIHDLYSERSFVTIDGSDMMNSILNLLWEYREPRRGARCVAMRRTGRLFVHPCLSPLPFVCKVHAESILFNGNCTSFDPNWEVGPSGKCYFMHLEPQTWQQAHGSCLAAGGHLAVLESPAEAAHVKLLFKNAEQARIPDNDFAFIGFSDLFQRHHYRTVHGTRVEELGFTEWESQCVGNVNSTDADDRCGGIKRSGLLATRHCDVPAMFFCEKPAVQNVSWDPSHPNEGLSSEEEEDDDSDEA